MRPDLPALLRLSVAAPPEAARRILGWPLTVPNLAEAVVLVSILDTLLLWLLGGPPVLPVGGEGATIGPVAYCVILAASHLLTAGAFQAAGQVLGGTGTFRESLALVVWLEVVAIIVRAATAVVALAVPPLAGLMGLLGIAILLWCLVGFVQALHRFDGLGRPIGAVLLGALGVGLAFTMLLSLFGGPPSAA